jgi:hypothetical protein
LLFSAFPQRIMLCSVLIPFGFLAPNRRYLVYANGLCAAYSLVSAFYTAVPRPATLSRSWIVFLLDQVIHWLLLYCCLANYSNLLVELFAAA